MQVLQRQFKHFALLMGLKGFSSRILLVEGLAPEQVYKRLYNAVQKGFIIKDKKVEQNAVVTV